ncbi:ROK family protein [Streptomyces sp. NPDC058576]|uniref:ROK family protein n=1 Tax=Streptomyces sp. NPDC058576 TaxID=3346547 RepID=UPI003666E3DE
MRDGPAVVPSLEIGGTHVTAALIDLDARAVIGAPVREELPCHGGADEILGRIAATADRIDAPRGARWGVAVPGPFEYATGVARFEGVGKFDSLYGVDLGAELRRRMRTGPAALRFVNDADAFGIGEYAVGAAAGHARAVCLTLGSGVGSSFLDHGVPVDDGPLVPGGGRAHRLSFDGRPLEDTVSRRGIRTAYARASPDGADVSPDVRTIAERARAGEAAARFVLHHAFRALGLTMAPWLRRFEATVLVVGGSIAGSWDLVEAPLRSGMAEAGPGGGAVLPLPCSARRPEDAPLVGAARWAASGSGPLTGGVPDRTRRPAYD